MKKDRHPREVIGKKKIMKCERTGTCIPTGSGYPWRSTNECTICKRKLPKSKVQ